MTTIIEDVKLDFQDVLLMPKRSTLDSRAKVDITRTFKFKHSPVEYTGTPICVANMDSVGTFAMADALVPHNIAVALHKFYTEDQLVYYFSLPKHKRNPHTFYSMGITDDDFCKFLDVARRVQETGRGLQYLCIDVANGYSPKFLKFVRKVRSETSAVIMAGNVISGDMVYDLLEHGADIVKVGIGPGCLTGDTRILMANGTYKDIIDVCPGDKIINMNGEPATVKHLIRSGSRKVMKIRNAHFHKPLSLTLDHKCYVGDLSTVSSDTFASQGYKVLNKPTKTGNSKLEWNPAVNLNTNDSVGLMPRQIKFDLTESFTIDISEYFKHVGFEEEYNKEITSTYELGYLFGTFLGDGNSYLGGNYSGRVQWYFQNTETDIIAKVKRIVQYVVGKGVVETSRDNVVILTLHSKQWAALLDQFGKSALKHLPNQYYCIGKDYLWGLFDGLIDSDGHSDHNNVRLTNTSTQIIELFQFISMVLFDGCANVNKPQLQSSHRVTATNEAFTTFVPKTLEKRFLNDYYHIIKLLDVTIENEVLVPVYDLEIDDETHSFIANNMIVHNSVCTTRRITGVGYPQLSAIIECQDAAHGAGGLICGDGGIVHPGDFSKAFAAGSDFIMAGGIFAGHTECNGEIIETPYEGKRMRFYGMSSKQAMDKHYGGKANYRASEGKVVEVPFKGSVSGTIEEILGGLRSSCTYIGARRLKDMPKCATFVRVNRILNDSLSNYNI